MVSVFRRRAKYGSSTELSEFVRPHQAPGRELIEFLSAYYWCVKANSPSLPQNSLSSVFQNRTLEAIFRPSLTIWGCHPATKGIHTPFPWPSNLCLFRFRCFFYFSRSFPSYLFQRSKGWRVGDLIFLNESRKLTRTPWLSNPCFFEKKQGKPWKKQGFFSSRNPQNPCRKKHGKSENEKSKDIQKSKDWRVRPLRDFKCVRIHSLLG